MTYIYCLICPITKEVRYVGRSDTPYQRLKNNIANPSVKNSEWFSFLKEKGKKPIVQILANVEYEEADQSEREWIELFFKIGCNLNNRTLEKERVSFDIDRDKMYTMQEAALIRGVCKSSIFNKVVRFNLGKAGADGVIYLTKEEVKSLVFRAKNKKKYIYNLQRKKINYSDLVTIL